MNSINFYKKQVGATTLIITTLLIVSITMIGLFAANYGLFQQKISSNTNQNIKAFEAAEAGLEFGINYLNRYSATILANPINGYIQPYSSSSTTNVVLANGSKFTIAYTNPTANNYSLIQITSTGTNSDNTATRVIKQQVKQGSLVFKTPQNPLINTSSINMFGDTIIQNTQGNTTIQSGLNTLLFSDATTVLSTGTSSTASNIRSDIQRNLSSLANTSSSNFFSSYFGITSTAAKNKADFSYSNLGNYNSVLNGKTGVTIWIDQASGNVVIKGDTQVGTISSPVLLFINGNLTMSEQANITGFVVLLGSSASFLLDNAQINGALITISSLNLLSDAKIIYNNNTLTTLRTANSYWAKVPGSWQDF
jgi:Tfp pilus assembly protein PilX